MGSINEPDLALSIPPTAPFLLPISPLVAQGINQSLSAPLRDQPPGYDTVYCRCDVPGR